MTVYQCLQCNFLTTVKVKWTRHINTRKHINLCGESAEAAVNIYTCPNCNKNSYSYQSFWYHMTKSLCSKENVSDKMKNAIQQNKVDNDEVFQRMGDILKIQTQQMEQQTQMLEEIKNIKITQGENNNSNNNNNIINNTINGNVQNNTFNLNVFLNEHCKDALNITDYINNIQLHLEDLKTTARLGYTDGITKIISDRVKECGIFNRPFHCTDKKREIVYVKDNNIWEKEQSDKPKMKKMITNVIHKNIQQLTKWHEKFPECLDGESQKGNEFLHMMIEANGGAANEREKKEEVILKNILKEVIVEK